MEEPILLQISTSVLKNGSVEYHFALQDGWSPEVTMGEYTNPVDRYHLDLIKKRLQEQAELSSRFSYLSINPHDSLHKLGFLLTNTLLPVKLQKDLQGLSRPVLIECHEHEIPWELCYLDGEFLGLNHSVGRRLRIEKTIRYDYLELPESPSFLLIGNPTGDLAHSEEEIMILQDRIKKIVNGARIKCFIGEACNWVDLKNELCSEPFDFIHYSGHVECGSDEQSVLLLLGDEFTPEDARLLEGNLKTKRRHPLVFLNGCKPNATPNSIAKGFLQGGAKAVIAGFYDVADEGASEFAIEFYKQVLSGYAIGESMRMARLSIRERRSQDATWASYVLYGNPCRSVVGVKSGPEPVCEPGPLFWPNGRVNRDRFSPVAWRVLEKSAQETKATGWNQIRTPHLFIGLTRIENGCTHSILSSYGIDKDYLSKLLWILLSKGPKEKESSLPLIQASFGENSLRALETANMEALNGSELVIEEAHLLHSLLASEEGFLSQIFHTLGLTISGLKDTSQKYAVEGTSIRSESISLGEEHIFLPDGRLDLTHVADTVVSILNSSVQEARQNGWAQVRSPHLLLTLLRYSLFARTTLEACGLKDIPGICDWISSGMKVGTPIETESASLDKNCFSEASKRTLAVARAIGDAKGRGITEASLFLALLHEGNHSGSAQVLASLGLDIGRVRAAAEYNLYDKEEAEPPPQPEAKMDLGDIFLENDLLNASRFSPMALEVMGRAMTEARNGGWVEMRTPHLFIGLLLTENSRPYNRFSLVRNKLIEVFRKTFAQKPLGESISMTDSLSKGDFSENMLRLLETAQIFSLKAASAIITDEFLFEALLVDKEGVTTQVLTSLGLTVGMENQGKAYQETRPSGTVDGTPLLGVCRS